MNGLQGTRQTDDRTVTSTGSSGGSSRRRFLQAAGATATVGLAGCIGSLGGPGTIVFGQPAALTGKWDFLQPAVSQSTDLALQEIADAGGPLDAEVDLQRRDTAVNPQEARTVVEQLLSTDGAVALLGLFSSEITPIFDYIIDQATPVITPWPGSTALDDRGGDLGTPEDTSDDDWIWRTILGDTVHTIGAGRQMVDSDFSRMGLMNGTSQGERSWAEAFTTAYEGGGGEVVTQVEVEEGKSTYQSELDRLFGEEFDAWALAVALEDAVTVINEWADAGYGTQLLIEDGLRDPALIEGAGEAASGAWLASATGEGPGYGDFVSKFQDAGDAELNAWGVAAYDATNVAALACERAGEASSEAIQQNIGPVSRGGGTEVFTFAEGKEALSNDEEINYQGAATPVNFSQYGNVFGSVAVEEVTPDGFEQVATIPAADLRPLIDTY